MLLKSPVFEHNGPIPPRYTCDGEEHTNPPLRIIDLPPDTAELAIIMDDPDAPGGTYDHWLVWNIPAHTKEIGEHGLPPGALLGTGSSGEMRYTGPCPPAGSLHHYSFRVYALDHPIDLAAGSHKDQLLEAMEGHILEQAELIGTYRR